MNADPIDHTRRPYATGDPVRNGWGGGSKIANTDYWREKAERFGHTSGNLALYMGNHIGFLGGIVRKTDVPGILSWDCVTTDWFHPPSWPTRLLYNPFPTAKVASIDVGPARVDLYDAAAGKWIAENVRGTTRVDLPATGAAVLVAVPAGATRVLMDGHLICNDRVTDWRMP